MARWGTGDRWCAYRSKQIDGTNAKRWILDDKLVELCEDMVAGFKQFIRF